MSTELEIKVDIRRRDWKELDYYIKLGWRVVRIKDKNRYFLKRNQKLTNSQFDQKHNHDMDDGSYPE